MQTPRNLRFAVRALRRSPSFTVVVVLTLALGIGVNTAIFSVVSGVLLAPSPFSEPERLVVIWETDRSSGTRFEPGSWPDVEDFRARSRSFEDIGAVMALDATLTGDGSRPERVTAIGVTPNVLSILGISPIAGRRFLDGEGIIGGTDRAAILSEDLWRARFAGDPGIVGSEILVNDRPTTVVGVLPTTAGLGIEQLHRRADYSPAYAGGEVQLWMAMIPTEQVYPRRTHPMITLGRLAPGATLDGAQQELDGIAADLEASFPENEARGVNLQRFDASVFGDVRPTLLFLLGSVALVLLIACANITNLLLVRLSGRRRELAIRAALGASRARLAVELGTETLLLVVIGTAAGLALASLSIDVLTAIAPAGIPRLGSIGIDLRVLAFTGAVAALIALLLGVLPAVHFGGSNDRAIIDSRAGTRVSSSRGARTFRSTLVVAEMALGVTLVVAGGLLVRSFLELRNVHPGFEPEGVLRASYTLPVTRYSANPESTDLPLVETVHQEFLRGIESIPGIRAAALTAQHPLEPGFTNSFSIVGREAESVDLPEIRLRFVSPSYPQTLQVPLHAGRGLTDGDDGNSPPVAVINAIGAERYFAGADPVGQRIRFYGVERMIVGVIGNERFMGRDREPEPALYAPLAQMPLQSRLTLLARTGGDPMAAAPLVRAAMAEIDPQVPLYDVEPLSRTVSHALSTPRFTMGIVTLFSSLAIALALLGLHGVIAYSVNQRIPEFGIRMALGATGSGVVRLVVREGVLLAALGTGVGLLTALTGSAVIGRFLYGVSPVDPLVFLLVPVVAMAAAALASSLPASSVVRSDPARVLRGQ